MKRYITLPNGNKCGLPVYVSAWKELKASPLESSIKGWDHFPSQVGDVLRDIRHGVHDRINRHIPAYGQSRKWSDQWQADISRASRDLNTPRLAISWLPSDLRDRFPNRLRDPSDY